MGALADKRILILEDNILIGEVIAETLTEASAWPMGPVLSDSEAMDVINYNPDRPDAAILDVNIDGISFDVADRLQQIGVPFIFATGSAGMIPHRFQSAPVCDKPYTPQALLKALERAIAKM